MTDSNSTALRGALARAIKSHVDENGLNGVKAAALAGIANSRMSMILRGQVAKVSSDALADILGKLGYAIKVDGNEFALTRTEQVKALPDIEPPVSAEQVPEAVSRYSEDPYLRGISEKTASRRDDVDPDFDRVVADE